MIYAADSPEYRMCVLVPVHMHVALHSIFWRPCIRVKL